MPKTIPHRELRNNSSEILREVQSGQTFLITNNGKVVAMLTPPPSKLPADIPGRPPRIIGGFGVIPKVKLDHPIQDTLDDLRGDE